jgi:hypothetical protein
MPKNITSGLNRSRVEKAPLHYIKQKNETPRSALLISSKKIIAGDASLGADGA